MHTLLKSLAGPWPQPSFPPGIDRALEASRSRRRMYPVTAVYSLYLVGLLALDWQRSQLPPALGFCVLGVLAWTLIEYLVHRFVLHVAFPAGGGWTRRLLHHLFDASHADHHARPWDGYYINGHLDTLLVAVWLVPLGTLAPGPAVSAAIAGLLAAYVAEEWLHHAMHFRNFRWRHFQYLRRRHLVHHSRHGVDTAFGITSDFWDLVFRTRIPSAQRQKLLPARPAGSPGGR